VHVFPAQFLQRPSTDILETFPHDVALAAKKALLCQFPESAPNKMRDENPKLNWISCLTTTY